MVESEQVLRSPNYPKSYLRVPSCSSALAPKDVQSLYEGAPARGATENQACRCPKVVSGFVQPTGAAGRLGNTWGPQTELL